MGNESVIEKQDALLQSVEQGIRALSQSTARLRQENEAILKSVGNTANQNATDAEVIEKNRRTRAQIEKLIAHLKTLE